MHILFHRVDGGSIHSSMVEGICPPCKTRWIAMLTSSKRENDTSAVRNALGRVINRTITSVMMPSVPSDPMNKCVKLFPAAFLAVLLPVRNTRPSANTAVKPKT
jgi:hypothetical protein